MPEYVIYVQLQREVEEREKKETNVLLGNYNLMYFHFLSWFLLHILNAALLF